MGNNVRDAHSCRNPDMRGNAKKFSDCWEKLIDKCTELERGRDRICPDPENNCFRDKMFQKLEGDHPSYEKTSSPQDAPSGDCTKGDGSSWKPLQLSFVSNYSSLQNEAGIYRKDRNCAEGTSGTTSHRNKFAYTGMKEAADGGSPNDGQSSQYFLEAMVSTQQLSLKSEVASDTGKSFNPELSEELDVGRTKSDQVNAGEDRLKFIMRANFDDEQLKTESSSSNSKPVGCPVPSSDSGQKISLGTKACIGHKKDSGMNESVCAGFKCSLEEPPAKSIALGMAEQHGSLDNWKKIKEQKLDKQIDSYVAPKAVPDASITLRGKPGNLGKTSEAVETFRARDSGNMLGMIAENSMILVNIDGPKTRLLKQKNAKLLSKEEEEMELTDDLEDALEVARRVAREVEEEVGIYTEASGSSSSIEESYGQTVHLSTADSVEPKKKDCLAGAGDTIQSCIEQYNPDSCCSTEEVELKISARNEQLCSEVKGPSREINPKRMHEVGDGLHEEESSQLTTIPDDLVGSDQTNCLCGFDLNEDIQAEEVEYPEQPLIETVSSCHVVIVSTPIPVMATSTLPVCLPMTPLQFEGELGWRGSATTSAFRPATLSKTSNKKAFLVEENNCNSRRSQGFLGIDLNVSDAGDNSVIELFPEKHISESAGLHSGESSVEVSSKRVEKLNIDLNRLGNNADNRMHLSADWRMEHKLHIHTNGTRSPPTSLSRSFIEDFDLNDNPSFGDAHDDAHRLGQGTQHLRNRVSDDRIVSFAGTTFQLDSSNVRPNTFVDLGSSMQGFCHGQGHGRMEFVPVAQPFLMAASNVFPSFGQTGRVVPLQPTLTYTQPPPAFPCNNGFGIGPTVPLPPTIYPSGVVPYMIDTRGATTIPQILGSGTLPAFARAPYLMEGAGRPCPSDIAILRPNLDLNVGIPSLETRSRGGSTRQLFIPANNSSMEEQMMSFPQVALSGTSIKRKEPECGWDSYQVGYRQWR